MKIILFTAGERRYFRTALNWLGDAHPDAVRRNLSAIAELGRWDDFYALVGTKMESEMFKYLNDVLVLDTKSKTPSLLAKWLKSCNASSKETQYLGKKTARAFGLTERQYRKILSILRERINIVERLMSENRWDEIEFDKIPSKAGLIYKNAFARHDIERIKAGKQSYEAFANDENSKVNAGQNFPYEMVRDVVQHMSWSGNSSYSTTERKMVEKYWNQQKDYLNGKPCRMMCVVDTSGSMRHGIGKLQPIDVAISLGMYCAERIGGPFKNHYISFSSRPQFIKIEGVDFVDKVTRIYETNLCENTDLVKTFELLRKMCLTSLPEDCPETIAVISDMQIDSNYSWGMPSKNQILTEMETERKRWEASGLKMPRLVYWDVNAVNDTILDAGPNVSFVSGASPALFEQVLTGKTGYDLMMETLNQARYREIR